MLFDLYLYMSNNKYMEMGMERRQTSELNYVVAIVSDLQDVMSYNVINTQP